jgi:hypothetical protein
MNPHITLSVLFVFAAIYFAPCANAQAAPNKNKIICDHAAPPRGMHWVCKSQCDCHLEGKLKNDEDGIAPASAPASDASEPKVCKYEAPMAGELLVCDADCKCRPYLSSKKKSKKKATTLAQ